MSHDPTNPDCPWNYPSPLVKGTRCDCPTMTTERINTIGVTEAELKQLIIEHARQREPEAIAEVERTTGWDGWTIRLGAGLPDGCVLALQNKRIRTSEGSTR